MDNHIEIEKANHLIIVHFYGEIDSVMAPVYRGQLSDLIDESEEDVIFDFQNTSFIDSSGIGLVLGRYNQLNLTSINLHFHNHRTFCILIITMNNSITDCF